MTETTVEPPGGRRTQRQRRAESEGRLLAATAELIVERGVAGLSLAAIGARAGCSHALVNHLFGSKAAMLDRLNEAVDELYRSRMPPVVEHGLGVDGVVALAETYLGMVSSTDPLARVHVILWAQAVAGATELRDSRIAWDRHFRDGVAAVLARKAGVDDAECQATAFVIVGLLRGVAMQHLLDPDAVPLSVAIERVAVAVRGLMAD